MTTFDFRTTKLPASLVLTRDLQIDPYGSIIPKGAKCRAYETFGGCVDLRFEQTHDALRQWDNTLRLYPDCVEPGLLNALEVHPESIFSVDYRRLAAGIVALLTAFV